MKKVPVLTTLDGEGTMPTPPRAALELIRTAWQAWSKGEVTDQEFGAGVAEAVEGAGFRVIESMD